MCKNTWGQSIVAIKKTPCGKHSAVVLSRTIAKKISKLATKLVTIHDLWPLGISQLLSDPYGPGPSLPRVGGSGHAAVSNSGLRFTPFLASWAKASVFFAFFPQKKTCLNNETESQNEMERWNDYLCAIKISQNITLAWKCCLWWDTPTSSFASSSERLNSCAWQRFIHWNKSASPWNPWIAKGFQLRVPYFDQCKWILWNVQLLLKSLFQLLQTWSS